MNDTTVVLRGAGPKIRVSLPQNSKITLVTKDGIKTVNIDRTTNIRFAA